MSPKAETAFGDIFAHTIAFSKHRETVPVPHVRFAPYRGYPRRRPAHRSKGLPRNPTGGVEFFLIAFDESLMPHLRDLVGWEVELISAAVSNARDLDKRTGAETIRARFHSRKISLFVVGIRVLLQQLVLHVGGYLLIGGKFRMFIYCAIFTNAIVELCQK